MNLIAALSIVSTVLPWAVAPLSLGLSKVPGGRPMRWLAAMCFASGLFALSDLPLTLSPTPAQSAWCLQINVNAAALFVACCMPYQAAFDGRRATRLERALAGFLVVISLLFLWPGLMVTDGQVTTEVHWLGVRYVHCNPTTLGSMCFGAICGVLLVSVVHFARRDWQGVRAARENWIALVLLFAMGIHDSIVSTFFIPSPLLLDSGFCLIVAVMGFALVRRFVANALRLRALTTELEQTVELRTRELSRAEGALQRAENLAAIGQLAAGVAHEVNNPAAVILANLTYLNEELCEGGAVPGDARECLDESLHSVKRISAIVRQLLDAGRVAANSTEAPQPFELKPAVTSACANARVSLSTGVDLTAEVPDGLWALGSRSLFEQVVLNLVVNAAHAMADGRKAGMITVGVTASNSDQVQVTVADQGPGISADVKRRLFEPFVTTKAPGKGTGLGLAVSLGLMKSQGGGLSLLSTSERGTTFAVELKRASQPKRNGLSLASEHSDSERLPVRVLLVDDEVPLLTALKRQLARFFVSLDTAPTVNAAMERLSAPDAQVDVILCDVMMPDGGGEELLGRLISAGSPMATKVLFMTGGATSDTAQRFVAKQQGRVLRKPIDLAALLELVKTTAKREETKPRSQLRFGGMDRRRAG
ncbi:MAG: ATP-binding protein [Myxococcaceae bacterium]